MKNSLFKSTFREIRGSFGRWIAILAIVALGVGFFSGLKTCKEAFLKTGDTYLDEHVFFDYCLISTLGLEDEDIEALRDIKGVSEAEGSYSADVLITTDDADSSQTAAKFITLSESINTPKLVSGQMPRKGNECLGDASLFTEDDIGKKIIIESENKSDTLDMLKYNSYTITGIADSPLYLNFERGSTSIGDGSISCFIILPTDGFSSDVFTEAYIKLDDSAEIYSDEYDRISQAAEKPLEDALAACSQRRYDSIIDEARSKVTDAEDVLAEKKEDLADARAQIEDKRSQLDEGQRLIESGLADYENGLSQYESQKTSAYQQLDQALSAGMITQEEYAYRKAAMDAQFEESLASLEAAKSQLDSKQIEIDEGRAALNDAEAQLSDGEAKVSDAEKELADARKKISDIEYPSNYVLDRNTNIGYVCFDSDISIVEGIAKIFPIFFFLVAALVCMTTMSRMIEEQRTQIGVLKALGYSSGSILGKYLFYSGSSALLGGIMGFFAGTAVFTWVIWEAYGIMYGFSDVIFVFDWALGGLSLLAALICSVGTTVYSCYSELSQVPAQLIRPKAPAAGKRIFMEKIPLIWNRLKFLQKVSIRNVFRYKKRFFMMILGICGCTALLVTGLGLNDSIKNVVSMQYDEIYHVDYEVTFSHDISESEKEAFLSANEDYIGKALFLYSGSVDAKHDDHVKSINLIVCDSDAPVHDFIDLHNGETRLEYPGKGEGIINSNLAKTLNISAGDELTVYDSDMSPMTVRITGLCDNYVYNYLYVNTETYAYSFGEPETNTAFILGTASAEDSHGGTPEESGELSPHETGAILMNSENVASVSVTEDFRNRISNMMKSLDYIIALVVLSAGALAFIVLYNLTNINITERIREIATIKVLGFYPRETSSYVFRENVILTIISALVGLPLGKWLHQFVMEKVQIDMLSFDIHISPLSYLLGIVGTFVFAAIVNLAMRRKLNNISMTESLKSIE